MYIINFSYSHENDYRVMFQTSGGSHELPLVNICRVMEIFEGNLPVSNLISENFENYVNDLLNNIFDPDEFAYKSLSYVNQYNIKKQDVKSTLLGSFNKRLNELLDSIGITNQNIELIGNTYTDYIQLENNKKITKNKNKNVVTINSTDIDLNILEDNLYQINIQNAYHSERVFWTLKDDYKVSNVINQNEDDITKWYSNIDINRFKQIVDNFSIMQIPDHQFNYYAKMIDDLDSRFFDFDSNAPLTGNLHDMVISHILSSAIKNISNEKFKKYIELFLIKFHIIDGNNINTIHLFSYFLDILKEYQKLNNGDTWFIESFQQKVIKEFFSISDIFEIDEDSLSSLYSLINFTPTKKDNIKKHLEDLLDNIGVNHRLLEAPFRHKNNLNTEKSIELLDQLEKSLYDSSINVELNHNDVGSEILLLSSFSFKIFRKFYHDEKWKINNPFLELLLNKLEYMKSYYLENMNNLNKSFMSRITTLVSTYHTLKLRYNLDNKKYDTEKLIQDFMNDIIIMNNLNCAITYNGSANKILEDVGKLKFIANYYNIEIDLKPLYYKIEKKTKLVSLFLQNINIALFDDYENDDNRIVDIMEQACSMLGGVSMEEKFYVNFFKKDGISDFNRDKIFYDCFMDFIGYFNSLRDYKDYKSLVKVQPAEMEWKEIC